MENKPAQNIQDSFLNTARKDKVPITLYLLSGVKLSGRIRSFDKYSVVLESNNQEQLIFKHAISTVVMPRNAHGEHPVAPRAGTLGTAGEERESRESRPAERGGEQASPPKPGPSSVGGESRQSVAPAAGAASTATGTES
jgi:host factor-I protein